MQNEINCEGVGVIETRGSLGWPMDNLRLILVEGSITGSGNKKEGMF